MGFNGVVEIDKAIKFNVSVQRVFKLNALVPHLHNSTNDCKSHSKIEPDDGVK